ncbi:PAS domain-containing sensor histidine kinase [Haloferax sp. Atlit-10N]|uniref:histidine kinase n=1 Tax=Haloferax prahovense (strain DSM 18310 / JCM 13924 / TL6) TaxID=1227461 RepID=M0FV91_HALPT|nr:MULTISPECIES: PAS domain-containing sensor histidine kinase [Haloferax]ELZ63961.1 putative signal-transducing histidine kinase [Haloferax prahovense DSM 18310]RDZ40076.1 PAS domain-containing sensor histidine kinase [Haloferax sp. Atlit-19N]RDZ40238.1 PAS domain-containing sensor histidine kinase [Haloferax sp. Atlit-16N]RDZ56834.1 PAS domain-containing sensor histidine kinase [Haloferax sp. Atlit-10N]
MSNSSLGQRPDFQDLFDQLDGVALWTVSAPGEFDYISAGFEDIWGIPPEAVMDDITRLLDAIHPEDRDRVRQNIEASAQGAHDEAYEGRVVRPDGSVRWVLTRQVLLRDDDGDVSEVVGICTDITEQKRRERELELLNRIVRHDIRNDMGVVLGWAEMLEDHVDDDRSEYLQKILDSGEHVVELTEVARDYVETIASNESVTIASVPIRSILETELSIRKESFPEAAFVVAGALPDVEVAGNSMLSSVFRNLLNNAVQHNDKDAPRVEISCTARDDDVEIRIADNGPGIPDDRKELAFGKGERGLGSPGTGIGLYLVDTLVTRYGGSVRVEDNEPTGAVFVVELPRTD